MSCKRQEKFTKALQLGFYLIRDGETKNQEEEKDKRVYQGQRRKTVDVEEGGDGWMTDLGLASSLSLLSSGSGPRPHT